MYDNQDDAVKARSQLHRFVFNGHPIDTAFGKVNALQKKIQTINNELKHVCMLFQQSFRLRYQQIAFIHIPMVSHLVIEHLTKII